MKIHNFFILLICFNIGILLSEDSAYPLEDGLRKSSIFQPRIYGMKNNWELSTHPILFIIKPNIKIKLGEVVTAEYIVENLGDKETSGIATFVYFPSQFGTYISKINCFCYDVQTLKPGEQDKYTLVFFIDPEVTKDSKTKDVKEVTIQFTFFDYEEYKKKES